MCEQDLFALFSKYLANKCTEEEVHELFRYLKDPQNQEAYRELIEDYWNKIELEQSDNDFDKRMHLSFESTDKKLNALIKGSRVKSRRLKFKLISLSAACLLLLLGLYVFKNKMHVNLEIEKEVSLKPKTTIRIGNQEVISIDSLKEISKNLYSSNGISLVQKSDWAVEIINIAEDHNSSSDAMIKVKVAKGKKLKLSLLDHSVITINSGSILEVPMTFGSLSRELRLSGEAFFEVSTDKDWPFIVNAANQQVKVYGTKFNVKSYPDEDESTTTLLEGKVSVRRINKGVLEGEKTLVPGEKMVISKDEAVHYKRDQISDEKEAIGWMKGDFSYKNSELKDILKDFSRWYDVKVDWEGIPDLRFTGTIPNNYSIEKALDLINKTSNSKIILEDNCITLKTPIMK